MRKLQALLRQFLLSPRISLWVAALAFLFSLPALWSGFLLDDYPLRYQLEQELYQNPGGPQGPWDIFRFQGTEREHFYAQQEMGLWPWWTDPNMRLSFFRPLASLHHALDFSLWPDAAWFMHLESLILFGALAFVVSRLYRRLLGATVTAGLAALFFAVDDAHAMILNWISNRNAIWAVLFGCLALLFHDRWRRDHEKRAPIYASLFFTLGMLSGEAALGTTAYLFSYAVFVERRSWMQRAKTLLPYLLISLVWAVFYWSSGYGTTGGGFYIDPAREPLLYAEALFLRLPILLTAQLLFPPSDIWVLSVPPSQMIYLSCILWLVLIGFAVLLYRGTSPRPSPLSEAERGDREAVGEAVRFFSLGMVLSLFPVCATWPADRLLLFSGVGAFGLVALCLISCWRRASRLWRALALGLFLLHGVLAPLLLPMRINLLPNTFGVMFMNGAKTLPQPIEGKTIVFVNSPDPLVPSYAPLMRFLLEDEPMPDTLRILSVATRGDVIATRPDELTLTLTLSEGFLHDPFSKIFRGDGTPFVIGETVTFSNMASTVQALTPEGRPMTVSFTFDKPLEDASYLWVTWVERGFVVFSLPKVGEGVVVPTIDYNLALGM